jgi:hypothetical protein
LFAGYGADLLGQIQIKEIATAALRIAPTSSQKISPTAVNGGVIEPKTENHSAITRRRYV